MSSIGRDFRNEDNLEGSQSYSIDDIETTSLITLASGLKSNTRLLQHDKAEMLDWSSSDSDSEGEES